MSKNIGQLAWNNMFDMIKNIKNLHWSFSPSQKLNDNKHEMLDEAQDLSQRAWKVWQWAKHVGNKHDRDTIFTVLKILD